MCHNQFKTVLATDTSNMLGTTQAADASRDVSQSVSVYIIIV